MIETTLDRHHTAAEAGDEHARLRFFDAFASVELFVLLKKEASGADVDFETFDTEDGVFLLAFDLEERLVDFVGRIAPYAALSGRNLVDMIHGQGIGIALNPDVAPSSQLMTSDAIAWLADQIPKAPDAIGARPSELGPPGQLPENLILALDEKLAAMAGMARLAYLVSAQFEGRTGHLLAFIDAPAAAEQPIATAVAQTLALSGLGAAVLDVAFFAASDEMAARLSKVGLRFDLPQTEVFRPVAPGSDPARPPKLR